MNAAAENPYEFSRPLELRELDDGTVERTIIADSAERPALASRFDLLELICLKAKLTVACVPDSPLVRITGTFHTEAVQRCVVTLEPIAARMDERIDSLYGPEGGGVEISDTQFDEATPPEPFERDVIDIGELVAQQLALALDPYPRKSDAAMRDFNASELPSDVDVEPSGPFSELLKWRKERG